MVRVDKSGGRSQIYTLPIPRVAWQGSNRMKMSLTCQVDSAAAEVKEREAELRRREEELRVAQGDLHTRSQLLQARRDGHDLPLHLQSYPAAH